PPARPCSVHAEQRHAELDGGLARDRGRIGAFRRRRRPRKAGDRLPDRRALALRDEDRLEEAVLLRLVHDGRLVRLHLGQRLAAAEALARRLEPAHDHRVGRGVGQLRHRQLRGHQPANSSVEYADGNGAARPRSRICSSCALTSCSSSSSDAGAAPSSTSCARNTTIGSRARQSSSSPTGRYAPGSLREWPTNRYVSASRNAGPEPERAWSIARAAASRTVHTLIPSTVSAGTPMTSARARISPAVTSRNAVYSP